MMMIWAVLEYTTHTEARPAARDTSHGTMNAIKMEMKGRIFRKVSTIPRPSFSAGRVYPAAS